MDATTPELTISATKPDRKLAAILTQLRINILPVVEDEDSESLPLYLIANGVGL